MRRPSRGIICGWRIARRENSRGFLLSTLDYFLAREWNRAHRQKRGGQFRFISLDAPPPEVGARWSRRIGTRRRQSFERALTVLKQAMAALEAECGANGKAAFFQEAKSLLSGERDGGVYARISRNLAMSEGAARVAVHRLRQRYGELLRREVAHTVSSEEEVMRNCDFSFAR